MLAMFSSIYSLICYLLKIEELNV